MKHQKMIDVSEGGTLVYCTCREFWKIANGEMEMDEADIAFHKHEVDTSDAMAAALITAEEGDY